MKLTKILLATVCVATLAFTISCDNATSSNTTANNANNNTAVVVNNNQMAKSSPTPASNMNTANDGKTAANDSKTAAATNDSDSENVSGELQVGKTESVILYVGMETGDYAAYCFTNDSEAGRALLAACKDGDQCEVKATLGEGTCKVPGLEADLSASFRISKVASVKSLGKRK